jgi:hypothetical protein
MSDSAAPERSFVPTEARGLGREFIRRTRAADPALGVWLKELGLLTRRLPYSKKGVLPQTRKALRRLWDQTPTPYAWEWPDSTDSSPTKLGLAKIMIVPTEMMLASWDHPEPSVILAMLTFTCDGTKGEVDFRAVAVLGLHSLSQWHARACGAHDETSMLIDIAALLNEPRVAADRDWGKVWTCPSGGRWCGDFFDVTIANKPQRIAWIRTFVD